MEPNRVASSPRRSKPSVPDCKPKQPIPVGIIRNTNGFLCLICDRELITLQGSVKHSESRQHVESLSAIKNYCQNAGGRFTCKLCNNHTATNWNSFLLHFYLEGHFDQMQNCQTKASIKSPKISGVSYHTLESNQIIELHTQTYFCCCCASFMDEWAAVIGHIAEEKHRELQRTRKFDDCDGKKAEHLCRKLAKNNVSHISHAEYYCYLCDRLLTGLENCIFHMESSDHMKNIVNQRLIDYRPLYAKLKRFKNRGKKDTKLVKDPMPVETPSSRLLRENSVIGPSKNGKWYCKLCGCTCYSLLDATRHVSGKRHEYSMERANCKESSTESKETENSTSNSSDSWETYECVSDGYEFSENPSISWETFDIRSLDSWETISAESLSSEPLPPKLLKVPKDLISYMASHLLQHRKKEIYCPACDAHIKDPLTIVDHVVSQKHMAESSRYRAKVAQKPKTQAVALDKNNTPSLDSKLAGEKKSLTNQSTLPERKLMHIPADSYPLLKSHFLTKSDYEVSCPACEVHLSHMNNVYEHVNGRSHKMMLKVYKNKLANKPGGTTKSLKMNTAVYTPTCAANKKPLSTKSQDNVTPSTSGKTAAQTTPFGLMNMPSELIPLIPLHSLRILKNEITCPACDALIRNVSALVSHTKSRGHIARLKEFRNSTASKNMTAQTASQPGVAKGGRELDPGGKAHVNKMEQNRSRLSRVFDDIIGLEKSIDKLTIANAKEVNVGKNIGNTMKQQDEVKMSRRARRARDFKNGELKQQKPQVQNNKRINGRSFDPKYLKVEMQYIYELNPEKLRIMKLSCQSCFPKTSKEVYCLICEKSVPSELQTFYEHICSTAHTQYLADAEMEDKQFIPYPEQFSDLSLAKEFMQQTPAEETIQCLACDENMDNNDLVISEHIKQDSHKEEKQVWNVAMEKILQDVMAKTESTWYNIQKYWCQPCDTQFNTEFQFAEHMETKKHDKSLKKIGTFSNRLVYDACIPCATLWLGFSGLYPQHCNQPMHKYLLQTGDYSVCTLPGQVKTLLENSEVEVEKLIKLSDQVSTVEKVEADTLLKCLEDTVKPRFPNARAHPFGSRVSGLGFPDSDIDVFLDCGTYKGVENTRDIEMEILMSVEKSLRANQRSWEIEETLTSSRTPIIKLRHRSTEMRCDVSFKNGLSVENTRLLKCFMDNYPLCRKLMLFIKKWLNFCNLSGSQYITNYAICWYIIFYLQSKSVLPSVASMIAKGNKSKMIDGWETGICETFDKCQKEFTFTQLLHGFFVFYSDFDYRYSVACPILGRTIPKQDFTELHLLPKEMKPYVKRIETNGSNGPVELFRIDSEMCVQDPYDLSHNLTKAVRKFTLNRFKQLCAASADVLINFKSH